MCDKVNTRSHVLPWLQCLVYMSLCCYVNDVATTLRLEIPGSVMAGQSR